MPAVSDSKYLVTAGWSDVPHLDEKVQAELLASTPPHLRDARSKGTPSLGAGAIYPIEQSEFVVQPFAIPAYWPKAYGLDVGWNTTAAIFGAWDRDSDVMYLYSEHYRGQADAATHAAAIKARGEWIHGTIDPASAGASQRDGKQLAADYNEAGLHLIPADNGVESGIHLVRSRLEGGRLKVFSTLQNWLAEHRIYRRDEHGQIVKKMDHAMDATRYLVRMAPEIMKTAPVRKISDGGAHVVADKLGGY